MGLRKKVRQVQRDARLRSLEAKRTPGFWKTAGMPD